ncbi:TetR/AcrR family transcriptional regulator [Paenibacillus terrigena]|uniref:TetR/AcrR family transcriptional regulator n=1 Tax=Paenibacillus terrigena TaxID=369333 RepID=UPI0028D33DBF|nr:TetR/AcrR family transcriptional regulator [Paenibacillus terrigena]
MITTKISKLSNRQKAVEAAAELFLHKGYHDSSMDEVVAISGVSKSNIYYHFKSKEELTLEVIAWRIARYELLIDELNALQLGVANKIDILFEMLYREINERNCVGGNPFISLWNQVSIDARLIRTQIHDFFERKSLVFRSLIMQGTEEGTWSAQLPIESTTVLLVSSLEGALFLAEVHQNAAVLLEVKSAFLQIMHGYNRKVDRA